MPSEKDIELYFSRKFADDESCFAVTFCKREKVDDEDDLISVVKTQISTIAKKNGYALINECIEEYTNMYFILWEVLERKK